MSNFEEEANIEEPETIFDLEPDELEFLIKYRSLSPENQEKVLKYFGIELD